MNDEIDSAESPEGFSRSASSDGWENPSSQEIEELLKRTRRIAVVGLSPDPAKPSNGVAAYLRDQGYEIVPINPNTKEVFGIPSYPDLASAPGEFDIVDIFRRSADALEIVKQAIAIGAPAIWLQEGVISPEGFKLGLEAGRMMIMNRCILKDHNRLMSD
jgi:predicted CoA-binding protein